MRPSLQSIHTGAHGSHRATRRAVPAERAAARPTPEVTTVVVTGASSGIGRAFARRLGAEGANLLLVGRDRPRLEAVAADASAAGAVAELVIADLTDEASLAALARKVTHAAPDLLVNAAGLARFGNFSESELERADTGARDCAC
jgi:short-subunit dehydrogenase